MKPNIKVQNVGDSFVVSEDSVWIDGRYESEEDAILAADVCPSKLNDAWKASIADGKEGLITHDSLMRIKD